jgi:choline kinase
MKIVILSAGKGLRLRPITSRVPKCLIEVSSKTILKHQLDLFIKHNQIEEIIIIIGYKADLIKNYIKSHYNSHPKIKLLVNKSYNTTNNMFSLYLAKQYINNSLLLMNGDVILDKEIVNGLIDFPFKNAIAVDIGEYNKESMKVIQKNNYLIDISKKINKQNALGCSIDFYKFSEEGKNILFNKIEEFINIRNEKNLWTEVAIQSLLRNNQLKMKAYDIKDKTWIEIDNLKDLKTANKLFSSKKP